MIANALRLASAARLLAYAAALTALVPLSRCRAAVPEARPLDPARDPRLARRMILRCEETPISGVLRRIQEQTGILLRAEGRAGDERLVAFVPGTPLHEVLASLADLHRLRWRRGEAGGKPSYTLYKDREDARQEEALRQQGRQQALAELRSQLETKRQMPPPSPRFADAAAVQQAFLDLIPSLWDRLLQEGFLSQPVRSMPEAQRATFEKRLQAYLLSSRQERVESNARIAELLRAQGREVPKSLTDEPPPPSQPADCTFILTLNLANGIEAYAGLRDGRGTTHTFFQGQASTIQTLGVELYRDRTLRPETAPNAAPAGKLPERLTRPLIPVPGDSRFQRLWAEKLAQFSDSTGMAVYSDLYPRPERVAGQRSPRNETPLPQGPSAAAVLDQLCGDHLANSRDANPGTTSVWWPRGQAVMIRSRNWLWASQTVLPAGLVERLETGMRERKPLQPADVPVLASLSLPQVQGMWGFIGAMDAWHYLVRVPARLSPLARQLLVSDGITWENLPPPDRELLLRLLPAPPPGKQPDYSAQLRLAGFHSQLGTQASIALSGVWEGMKHSGSLDVQVPDRVNRPGLLVLADARTPVPRQKLPKLVCALYYPWYGVPAVSGSYRRMSGVDVAGQKIANFAHYPASGPYDSSDEATLKRHVAQAKEAGIDVLVCSWWGKDSFEDAAFRKLLPLAKEAGLQVCVFLEPYQEEREAEAIARGMGEWLKAFGQDPAYLRVEGRPVVFLYVGKRQQADLQTWAAALAGLDRAQPPGAVVVTARQTPVDTLVFDGIQNAGAFYLGRPGSRIAAIGSLEDAKQRGRIAVAAVGPGFDLRHQSEKGLRIERENGKLYRECWEGALLAAPDWVLVESFNQWEIGTEIEPSVQFGDQYLKLTAEYAARFKAAKANH